ncbi:MAG TPA: nucleotide exchange factor GrpE [Candidatus Limnocylindria bacterium]|nr:nucleotide exchange factor GrpE [Candidatus Limnocylindria bacterium]
MTDRPTNGDAREAPDQPRREERGKGPSRAELLAKLEELNGELERARASDEEHLRAWQRSAADFANYRRRTDEEREVVARFANATLIGKLLAVVDDFDRALENVPQDVHEGWVDGVRLVERKLRAVLESEGVTPIDAVGQPFDPNLHEAVVHEETADHPDNHVIGELQRGYRLHDRILRPALVRVANNPASNPASTAASNPKEH